MKGFFAEADPTQTEKYVIATIPQATMEGP